MYDAPNGKKYANKRAFVFERDGGRCLRCGSNDRLTLDHVVPRIRGGSNHVRNLQLLCQPCNGEKGGKIIDYRVEEHRTIEPNDDKQAARRKRRQQAVQRRALAKIGKIPQRKRATCDRNTRGGVGSPVYCPHCMVNHYCRVEAFYTRYRVRCGLCRTKGPAAETTEQAVLQWNAQTFDEVYGPVTIGEMLATMAGSA